MTEGQGRDSGIGEAGGAGWMTINILTYISKYQVPRDEPFSLAMFQVPEPVLEAD